MKKKLSVIAVLLLAVITTAYSVSGTYAKYTSTFNGTSDSARVARWAFKVNSDDVTNSFVFNLFDTVKDTVDDAIETDVDVKASETIIAPGTTGQFQIVLQNDSEVRAEYAINYDVTNEDNIPIEFRVNGTGSWSTDLTAATTAALDTMEMNASGAVALINIEWRWAFTGDASENYTSSQTDTTDTDLGVDGTATVSVKADIVVTQID